ncbi:MAG: T9SS type A sorting domain-containing protein [Flavobacteriia bacterium]|nr:T9SS type A sorting domain-containing protein [Flavobacteriia bacterium]
MKTLNLSLLLIPFSFNSQNNLIQENKVNVSVLLVDYNSPSFEGGNLSYYDCSNCSNDSLPFVINYVPPGDFGNIQFQLVDGDTLFNADIIWMGMGQLFYPQTFTSQYPFTFSVIEHNINVPITYYDMNGQKTSDSTFIDEAQDALNILRLLSILDVYFALNYQIAVYLWPPTVGAFDPDAAKWVVFLYYNNKGQNVLPKIEHSDFLIYPNPVNDILTISNSNDGLVEIIDITGSLLLKSTEKNIDVSALQKGCYYVRRTQNNLTIIDAFIKN